MYPSLFIPFDEGVKQCTLHCLFPLMKEKKSVCPSLFPSIEGHAEQWTFILTHVYIINGCMIGMEASLFTEAMQRWDWYNPSPNCHLLSSQLYTCTCTCTFCITHMYSCTCLRTRIGKGALTINEVKILMWVYILKQV